MSPLLESAGVRSFGLFKAAGVTSGFTSIATITAAGGESSLTFSSIPQTYTDLQLRVFAKDTFTGSASATQSIIYFNGDTAANYAYHQMYGNGSAVSSTGNSSATSMAIIPDFLLGTGLTNIFGAGIYDIADYRNTSKYKTLKALGGGDWNVSTTNASVGLGSGLWMSTAAITSITLLKANSGFAAGSIFALYGIKAAA